MKRLPQFCLYLLLFNWIMVKREKIIIEKRKKRIPLPQKPPKVEKSKKVYDRKKEKEKLRKKRNKEE